MSSLRRVPLAAHAIRSRRAEWLKRRRLGWRYSTQLAFSACSLARMADPDSAVSVDADGELHLKALAAEVIDPVVVAQRDAVVARLPRVPLTELLIEIDRASSSPPP